MGTILQFISPFIYIILIRPAVQADNWVTWTTMYRYVLHICPYLISWLVVHTYTLLKHMMLHTAAPGKPHRVAQTPQSGMGGTMVGWAYTIYPYAQNIGSRLVMVPKDAPGVLRAIWRYTTLKDPGSVVHLPTRWKSSVSMAYASICRP